MRSGRGGGREGISGQTETHEPVAEELSALMTTDTGRLAVVRGQTKAIFNAVYPRFGPRLSETLVDTRGRSPACPSRSFVHAVCVSRSREGGGGASRGFLLTHSRLTLLTLT